MRSYHQSRKLLTNWRQETMAQVLFVVHGMGEYKQGWSGAFAAKLDAMASQYDAFRKGAPFSERLEIVEIRYDEIFAELTDGWSQDADAFDRFATQSGVPLPRLVSWLKSPLPTGAKAFFWSS